MVYENELIKFIKIYRDWRKATSFESTKCQIICTRCKFSSRDLNTSRCAEIDI